MQLICFLVGAEVKAGMPLKVRPQVDHLIHLSQVCFTLFFFFNKQSLYFWVVVFLSNRQQLMEPKRENQVSCT